MMWRETEGERDTHTQRKKEIERNKKEKEINKERR